MEIAASSEAKSPNRAAYSCIRCANRKVRCDRQQPCSACMKHDAECIFRPVPLSRKNRKRVKVDVLRGQLPRYEALLPERGINPKTVSSIPEADEGCNLSRMHDAEVEHAPRLPTPSSINSEPERCITKTQLLHHRGRSKFVDNGLWTRVVEQFPIPEEALEDSSRESSDRAGSEDDDTYVLDALPRATTRHAHPPVDRINQMWHIFVENVDPLTKLVHVPTLRLQVTRATTNLQGLSRSFEALLFAIYGAAVMSLKEAECEERLGEPRRTLLSRYTSATKAALSRAKFMGTTNIVLLQALVLHLVSVRGVYDPRTLWTLTGVAMRIAEGMGLHRDGSTLGLPPFESEIRRRIWWQLKMHEARTAELSGLAKFQDFHADFPKRPININDEELYPGMTLLAVESARPTDMIFCAFRSELGNFVARHAVKFGQQEKYGHVGDDRSSKTDMEEKDEAINELEEMLETRYLRYCDPSEPLQLMTMLLARACLNNARFLAHHPRRWGNEEQIPESERQYVWTLSIKLLEQHNMMQSTHQLQRFSWHVTYYLQWHVFIHILDTLRGNPYMQDSEASWHLVESIYDNNPDMVTNTKKPLHVAVGNLCLKAWTAREAACVEQGKSITYVPKNIIQLREQLETTKTRRKGHNVWNGVLGASNMTKLAPYKLMGEVNDKNGLIEQSAPLQYIEEASVQDPKADLAYLSTGEFEEWIFSVSGTTTDMDPHFMLAQHISLEDNSDQTFGWAYWDALLSDSNVSYLDTNVYFDDRAV